MMAEKQYKQDVNNESHIDSPTNCELEESVMTFISWIIICILFPAIPMFDPLIIEDCLILVLHHPHLYSNSLTLNE